MLKHMDISAPAGVVRQTRSHGRARVQTKAFLPGFPTLGNKSKERTEKKEQVCPGMLLCGCCAVVAFSLQKQCVDMSRDMWLL